MMWTELFVFEAKWDIERLNWILMDKMKFRCRCSQLNGFKFSLQFHKYCQLGSIWIEVLDWPKSTWSTVNFSESKIFRRTILKIFMQLSKRARFRFHGTLPTQN